MMEGNNDIFLAGDDALWLAEPVHKKQSMMFTCTINVVFASLMTNFSIFFSVPMGCICAHLEYPCLLR